MPLVATRGAASVQGFGEFAQSGPFNYIEDVFSTYLYTGTGTARSVTNNIDLSTKGGLVWIKSRSNVVSHNLYDTARGTTKFLVSNNAAAQGTSLSGLTSFTTTGFGLSGDGNSDGESNANGYTYVSWTFRKQAKFFDVVTYTGNGTAGRVLNHSLGSTPGCIIWKQTSASGENWGVYHRSLGLGPGSTGLWLNLTSVGNDLSNRLTAVGSTSVTLGSNAEINGNGASYVMYFFAHNAGGFGLSGTDNVISCGSYTGNGSATGPSVTLGYEPQWVLVKMSGFAGNWYMLDTMRGMAYTVGNELYSNLTAAEITQSKTLIPTATGFNVATTDGEVNTSGRTYIYIAIRRGPMKTPTSGTSVFTPVARSGTGGTSTVSNAITTDLIISMTRNTAGISSGVWDRLRGFPAYLETTGTASESTSSDSVTAMNNTAYVLGADSGTDRINRSGYTYANWTFGRAPGFFDEVCYTGTGTNTAFNHNLGVTPEMMIVKIRDSSTPNWGVWHSALSPSSAMLFLNTTGTQGNGYVDSVTSTTFSFATANGVVNTSAKLYVAYLFASCPGVSKVGSYTGTGALQTINCGFSAGARFVLIRRSDSTGDWYVWDSARGITSGNDPYLLLNTNAAEVTGTNYVDTDTTGFKVTAAAPAGLNASGGTYIFLAIA